MNLNYFYGQNILNHAEGKLEFQLYWKMWIENILMFQTATNPKNFEIVWKPQKSQSILFQENIFCYIL